MKDLKYYFKQAKKNKWAIGQFNFSNLEQLQGILAAAKNKRSPVVVGTSEGESLSIGPRQAVALVNSFKEETKLPIFLNLDHGKSFGYIKKVIDLGYGAVHFDGSELPLNENIKITKQVVEYAHQRGVVVEGEVGYINAVSNFKEKTEEVNRERSLSDIKEVKSFIKETGIDSLTINVGTLHGIRASGRNPRINLKRLEEIKNVVGLKPLVLHGGSGTSDRDIEVAIKLGITKVNINTELRIAYTSALKKVFRDKPTEITSYKYMPAVIVAVQKIVEKKMKLFDSIARV